MSTRTNTSSSMRLTRPQQRCPAPKNAGRSPPGSGQPTDTAGGEFCTKTPTATPRGWPSCERVALRGMPRGGLPAGPAGLTARFTRLGLIDREGPAFHLLALELGHRRFGRGAIGHLDKAKAFGAAGVAIRDHPDLVHHTIRLEELAEVVVGGAKRQIANKNIHGKFPMGKGTHDRQVIRTVCRSTMQEPYAGEGAREPRNHKTYLMVSSDSDESIPQKSHDGKRIT